MKHKHNGSGVQDESTNQCRKWIVADGHCGNESVQLLQQLHTGVGVLPTVDTFGRTIDSLSQNISMQLDLLLLCL
jgi:hypothetical protein